MDKVSRIYADKMFPCEKPCDSYGICEGCSERNIYEAGYNMAIKSRANYYGTCPACGTEFSLGDFKACNVSVLGNRDSSIQALKLENARLLGIFEKMDCDCGFDEPIGEGYQGGTCFKHEALNPAPGKAGA